MALLGFELLLRLFLGSFLCLFFVSRQETSEKFIRIAFRIGTGIVLSAALLLLASDSPSALGQMLMLFLSWLGLFFYTYLIRGPWRLLSFLLLMGSIGYFSSGVGILGAVGFAASLLFLGSVYMGQFLGHWFLNVPGMNIRELRRIVKILIYGLGLLTLVNLCSLGFYRILSESTFDSQLLYGMRAMWGLLPLYVLTYMIYRTTQMRSTQSTTGIYYAACIMALVGEAIAIYLKQTLGWIV